MIGTLVWPAEEYPEMSSPVPLLPYQPGAVVNVMECGTVTGTTTILSVKVVGCISRIPDCRKTQRTPCLHMHT